MLRYIRNKIITIREAVGVDIHFTEDGKTIIFGVHLKLIKGKVEKVAELQYIKDFKELNNALPKNIPVAISLNGKGIVMKRDIAINNENIINNLFPGSNPQDFVYSTHSFGGPETNIAYITRKSIIEGILKEIEKNQIRLLALTLGTNAIDIVLPFMHKGMEQLQLPTLTLEVLDNNVAGISFQDHTNNHVYKQKEIGENGYHTSTVLGLGNALSLLNKPADRVASDIRTTAINYFQKDYVYYKLFQFTGWAVLITTLSLLLINFFVFNHYYNKNKELVATNNLSTSQSQQSALANVQLDSSYNFFMRSGWHKNTRHGYFIDRIAALVPSTVKFTSYEAAPVQETIGMNEYVFANEKILISGVSNDPTQLETFSRAIKNIQGVQGVSIKNYLFKPDINAAVFTVEVIVNS